MVAQIEKRIWILTSIKIAIPGVWMVFLGLIILWIYNIDKNFGSSHWLPLSSKQYIGWALIVFGILFILLRVLKFIERPKS
jgi:Na+-transporting methylmalonyl-CoA/oxaloacetate decarboxylase gamma subunit